MPTNEPELYTWTVSGNFEERQQLLKTMGIIILDAIQGINTHQVTVQLPAGWHLSPGLGDNFILRDASCRDRAAICVNKSSKGATWTSFHPHSRYSADILVQSGTVLRMAVLDRAANRWVFVDELRYFGGDYLGFGQQYYAAIGEIRVWLDLHYPDWRDYTAYWD